jgi:REP element-mobilizing transposase RayT
MDGTTKGCKHVYSEILLHLNWHCKHDRPMITSKVEPVLHAFFEEYCRKTRGIHFVASGGIADHVHLAVCLEPFVNPSEFIGKLKGSSSHEMNKVFGRGSLQWQRGFGVVSFSGKHIEWVVAYVRNQKQHHAGGSTIPKLEEHGCDGEEDDREEDRVPVRVMRNAEAVGEARLKPAPGFSSGCSSTPAEAGCREEPAEAG